MRHCSIHSGTESPADSEEHEGAIGSLLSRLESDIKSGVHLTSLPDDLVQAMLANLHYAVALDEEIIGEVAL